MENQNIKIGQSVYSVFGSSVERVGVIIGINADDTVRIAKDATTCDGAENISLPLPYGFTIAD